MRRTPRPPARAIRGRPWREAEYAALDFETTGLDLRRDEIVSFGVVPIVRGRVMMAGSVHQLVRPRVPPSPRSQSVHLLRPQDLEDAPSSQEARAALMDLLKGRLVLAWFAEVEVRFLAAMFGTGIRTWVRRTIDVRNLAIRASGGTEEDKGARGYALAAQARRWGVPAASPHDALDDALVTAQLFLVLIGKLGIERPTVRDVLRIGRVTSLT